MIVELADFRTSDGDDFEVAMQELAGLFAGANGYHGHTLQRSIETAGRYVLLIRWDSVEAHNRFRESPDFTRWRERLGDHRDGIEVEHFETVLTRGWQLDS